MVVCDTLRPDYLSPYGAELSTQFFDQWASRGTVFENAYAAGPGSSISHAALFSGQYPSTSGVGGQVDLPEDVPHIAAHFQSAGYDTFGMPGPSRIGSHWKYDRGFDEYLEKWADIPSSISVDDLRKAVADPTLLYPMPKEFVRRALYGDDHHASYLLDVFARKTSALEEPYFSFVNVTITHGPYQTPRPYKEDAVPLLDRPAFGVLDRFGEERIQHSNVDLDHIAEIHNPSGFAKELSDDGFLTSAELDVVRSFYQATVEYLDDQLEALFQRLDRRGSLENTIVVLLSDHGEYLGERGLTGHMHFHYEECLHIPLILSGPGVSAGERRSDFVSLIDVFPTLCDLTGLDVPDDVDGRRLFGGRNRTRVFAENGPREVSPVFQKYLSDATVSRLERGLKSVRTTEHLYTLDSGREERLFETPSETAVSDPDPDRLSEYRQLVHDELGEEFPPGAQDDDFDEAIEENLRHLGYLS